MKKIIVFLFTLVLLTSCATVKPPLDVEYWSMYKLQAFDPAALVSADENVRQDAVIACFKMDPASLRKVITYLAYTLADEPDPIIRARTFQAMTELKAGAYIAAPLIISAGDSGSTVLVREVKNFISAFKPEEINVKELAGLLGHEKWQVRLLAARVIGALNKKGAPAMPEILALMDKSGADEGRYEACFDAASMINPAISIDWLILGLKNPSPDIRKNAMGKLFELYAFLGKKHESRKKIMQAFIRILYSDDEALSKTTGEMMSSMNDPEAAKAAGDYLKFSKQLAISAFNWTGKKMQEIFIKQEQDLRDEITVYFKLSGREDAIKNINQ